MLKRRLKYAGVAATAAAMFTLAACGGSGSTSSSGQGSGGAGSGSLEVFSWWTSGSEAAALDVLSGAFTKADPGTTFKNSAVYGGVASNARTVLATRHQGGNPPDSWQVHPDQDLRSVVEDGSVADVSDLYAQNGWADKLPEAVKTMMQVDGKYYGVPVVAGRANMLWTSPAALKKAGVELSATTTLTQFMDDLPKIKAAGVTPMCLGAKDSFASAQLLEVLMMSNLGSDGYNQLVTGKVTFSDPRVQTALGQFKTVLDNVNDDSAVLTWDQAALDVSNGECAATLMGDWAFGELTNKGKKDGTDFSQIVFPGTTGVYDFVGDAFVIPKENGPNPAAEKVWLTQLLDPTVQSQFNIAKGGAPVLEGTSLAGFPEYQKEAAASFQKDTIVSSLAHGQSAPAEFVSTYTDAVTSFLGSKNIDAFTKTMNDAQKTQLTS